MLFLFKGTNTRYLSLKGLIHVISSLKGLIHVILSLKGLIHVIFV